MNKATLTILISLITPLAQAATDCATVTEIPTTECEALVALYNSTDGDNWDDNSGWLENNTPCSWNGVTCSGGHVSTLYLPRNSLTGSIPTELGLLGNLMGLNLSGNSLTGSIPTELGLLSNLTDLYLYGNLLTGTIPTELGLLSNLTWLSLDNNSLTGSIPTELGLLSNLTTLHLCCNSLTGSIPTELGNLSNLTVLFLERNSLTGSIPTELGLLSRLRRLFLHWNSLTGTIPTELGNLSNLTVLFLEINSLTGSIPTELGNLSNLTRLDLSSNSLIGTIPTELGNLSELTMLYLDGNSLTGSIPPELAQLTNLSRLYLHSNSLTDSIPTELSNLSNLTRLILSGNSLTGTIPTELGLLSNLTFLSLSDNSLTGSIPTELGNLSNLTELRLDSNQLCGKIPSELMNLTNLSYLLLQSNNLINSDTDYDANFITWLDQKNSSWRSQNSPTYCSSQLQLTATNYNVNEGDNSATITVTRTVSNNGAVSVDYATSNGTATAPEDYTQTTGTLNWADGETNNKTFPITIANDTVTEEDETINITLTNATGGATIGEPNTAVLTIEDDEPTLITLAYFTATAFNNGITLEWQTELEIDNAGFHIWQSETKDGEYTRITNNMIPAQGSDYQYNYLDENVKDNIVYYYKLEDINLYGVSTFHAPISTAKIITPIENAELPARTITTFEWLNHPAINKYKLQFSNQSDFSDKVITMPKKRITDNNYTPKRREWRQIKRLGRQGLPIYWRVSAKTNVRFIYSEIGSFTLTSR
jgi:Leucine-rich repeat (LRR) protein